MNNGSDFLNFVQLVSDGLDTVKRDKLIRDDRDFLQKQRDEWNAGAENRQKAREVQGQQLDLQKKQAGIQDALFSNIFEGAFMNASMQDPTVMKANEGQDVSGAVPATVKNFGLSGVTVKDGQFVAQRQDADGNVTEFPIFPDRMKQYLPMLSMAPPDKWGDIFTKFMTTDMAQQGGLDRTKARIAADQPVREARVGLMAKQGDAYDALATQRGAQADLATAKIGTEATKQQWNQVRATMEQRGRSDYMRTVQSLVDGGMSEEDAHMEAARRFKGDPDLRDALTTAKIDLTNARANATSARASKVDAGQTTAVINNAAKEMAGLLAPYRDSNEQSTAAIDPKDPSSLLASLLNHNKAGLGYAKLYKTIYDPNTPEDERAQAVETYKRIIELGQRVRNANDGLNARSQTGTGGAPGTTQQQPPAGAMQPPQARPASPPAGVRPAPSPQGTPPPPAAPPQPQAAPQQSPTAGQTRRIELTAEQLMKLKEAPGSTITDSQGITYRWNPETGKLQARY